MVSEKKSHLGFSLFCGILLAFLNPSGFAAEGRTSINKSYLEAAAIFKESGEYGKAIEVLESVPLRDSNVELRFYLGRLYYLTGKYDESLASIESVESFGWLKYLYLGLLAEAQDRYQQALKFYEESNKLNRNSIALFRLGKISRLRKDYSKAAGYFSETISLDPSIRLAYYYAGECFLRMKDYDKAYNFLAKSFNFYPKTPEVKDKLFLVKDRLGKEFFEQRKADTELRRKKVKIPFYQPDEGVKLLNIGLATGLDNFSFSCAGAFRVSDGKTSFEGQAQHTYNVYLKGNTFILITDRTRETYGPFSLPADIRGLNYQGLKPAFYVLDVAYGGNNFWHKKIDRIYRGDFRLILGGGKFTLVNIVSLKEYLYGVLPSEIYADSHPEALKAQAVTARTIAARNVNRHKSKGFNLCADVHCQVYQGFSAEAASTNKAVDDTSGEIIVFEGKPIEAFYHSNCGGCLCSDAFGKLPYLANKIDYKSGCVARSPYEEESWFFQREEAFCDDGGGSKFRWQRFYDQEDFLLSFGFSLEELKSIVPLKKRDCFHYNGIKIIKSSEEFELAGDLRIRNYFDRLRSSAFKIDIKTGPSGKKEGIFFWGAGFGHGSGLCQEGASGMADSGYDYKEIIHHYFPSTSIKKIDEFEFNP